MAELSVSAARAKLPEVLDRVAAGEEITITRHGRPAAVLVRPDSIRSRRAQQTVESARGIGALLDAAREQPLAPADVPATRGEELVDAVRSGRDRS